MRISERRKVKIDLNEIQDEVVRPRIPRGKSGKDADRTEMIIPARVQFQQTTLSLSDKDLEALVDTGSEMEALAGFELFDKGALEDAQRPVALIGAGKSRIKGGNQGVTVNLTLPVCKTDGSIVRYKCLRVFIYVADIGRKLILGFPFFLRYNLCVVPGMPSLMQVPQFVHRTPHYQHGKPQSVHHVDLVQVQPPEQSIQDYDERIQVQRNTIANVRMTRHMSKIRYVHSEHRPKNTEGKRLKGFSSIHEYCWQIPCTNADCPRVFHTYSVWADPFFRDIPHLCERCAPRMSLNAKERVYSKEPSVNPPSDGVHHGRLPIATSARPVVSCGPVIHRMAFEKHVELVPQEVQGRRRKGVRKLTVALHSIEGKVPSPHSSPRPPSPMGHQGSRQREWPETDLTRQDATRDTQPEFFEHGLYVQLLSSQAAPPTCANSEDAGYDLYSAADVTILPWSKELIPTDIAIMGPKGTYARIADRSGMALKHSLHVMGGVVDRPYRENVQVILYNASQTPYHVRGGDKVSQFVLEQHLKPPISVVESLPATARGSAGFGSTGYRSTESMQHLLTHVHLKTGIK